MTLTINERIALGRYVYVKDWRRRLATRPIERPSNARNRCKGCGVELMVGAVLCAPCGRRKK